MPLTYPVDLNERYTLYDSNTSAPYVNGEGKVIANKKWPQGDGLEYDLGNNDHLTWLLVVEDPRPVADTDYDPLTHKAQRVATVYDTVAETATDGWEIVALTAQEIADAADNADRAAKLTNIGGKVATLRGWATQAEGVTVTNGNAVSVLQNVVDNLAVFYAGFADLLEGQRIDEQ